MLLQCLASDLVLNSEWRRIMRHIMVLIVMVLAMPTGLSSVRVAAQEAASATPEPRNTGTFSIGDRSLSLDCLGAGSPTVILDAGQDDGGAPMTALQSALAEDVLTCFYDRAGTGRSDPPPTWPRSAGDVVADLHALLVAAKVPGPYVLVGQSAGGNFVRLYARTYPEEVVGVVAMNPVPPADPGSPTPTPDDGGGAS